MALNRYEAKHKWIGKQRYHETPIGALPGVTTILSATEDKSGLRAWRKRVGDEEADRITQEGVARGNAVHGALEAFLSGNEHEPPDEAYEPFFESLQPVLEKIEDVHLIEGAVWSPRGYAGSVDALVQIEGELTLIDWKTSRKPKNPRYATRYYHQCAAYAGAINNVYRDRGIRIQRALVAIALEDRPAQVFAIDPSDMMRHWQAWLDRLNQYQAIQEEARQFSD